MLNSMFPNYCILDEEGNKIDTLSSHILSIDSYDFMALPSVL